MYQKMKLLLSMKILKGTVHIKILLESISIVRKIFIMNFEETGVEMLIPSELCQDQLPQSFRFYDPILRLIQEHCSQATKKYHNMLMQMNLIKVVSGSSKLQFKNYIDGLAGDNKL